MAYFSKWNSRITKSTIEHHPVTLISINDQWQQQCNRRITILFIPNLLVDNLELENPHTFTIVLGLTFLFLSYLCSYDGKWLYFRKSQTITLRIYDMYNCNKCIRLFIKHFLFLVGAKWLFTKRSSLIIVLNGL